MTHDASSDENFIASIASDVMRCLTSRGFFAALDDVLSPIDESRARIACEGDHKNSKTILLAHGFDESDFSDIFAVLTNRGGFCDCEILYNAVESSRLKAKYWRAQAASGSSPLRHQAGSKG